MKIIVFLLCFLCSQVFAAPVTSPFGWRVHPIDGKYKFHTGMDIGMNYQEPVGSVLDGVVVYASPRGGYGNCVIVSHGNDHTLYGHLDSIACRVGDIVPRGTLLGYVGSTGYSTGPHLHLEWWHDGKYCDPAPLLNGSYAGGSYMLPVKIDYGGITFAEPKGKEMAVAKVEKAAKKKERRVERELTLRDYMAHASWKRRTGHLDTILPVELKRKMAFKAAGIGQGKPVKTVQKPLKNGFSF